MADKIRELIKRCSVGKYSFDIVVNRDIARKGFEKNPKLFKILMNKAKASANGIDEDDVETILQFIELNDAMATDMPKFVADVLPEMIKAAGEEVDAQEFLAYCEKNDVDDIVNQEIYSFALLGFTEGRSVKKPKVNVAFE